MSYTIYRYSTINGEALPPEITFSDITVENKEVLNDKISSPLVGTDFRIYSKEILEGQLWRLSNYAYEQPPYNPINGQLWFDTSSNTLKVLTGPDYSADISDWKSLSSKNLSNIGNDIIPITNNAFDIGSDANAWNEGYFKNVYVLSSLQSRGNPLGSSTYSDIDSKIPRTAFDIVNTSDVQGETVGDAITLLSQRQSEGRVNVELIIQQGGTFNLEPEEGVRYRFVSDVDITVNLTHNPASTAENFELISAGLGKIILTTDPDVFLQINSDSGGTTCRFAYGSLIERDIVGSTETWQMVGNFV